MMSKSRESDNQAEYVERVKRYGKLLLRDSDGNPQDAIRDEILPAGAEPGNITSRMRFYAADDGYFIDESRNGDPEIIFREYMLPNLEHDEQDPASPAWVVGMERRKWMRFSEESHDVRLFLNVLEKAFGALPPETPAT
jgi:hypothetical protein